MTQATEETSQEIQVECSETSAVLRSIEVEVDAGRVKRAFDQAYEGLRKGARIKGFRPGKVPRSVLERMYGASLPDEVERTLVSETLAAAIEQAAVTPISEPDIEAESPKPDASFRYTARVEVKPDITLPEDLSSVQGQRPRVEVSEATIDAELKRIQEQHAQNVEEPEGTEAVADHVLTLDFEGRIDGELFEGGTAKGVELTLGTGTMVPGFEDQLMGAHAGDSPEVTVTFPDDYGPEEISGREAVFDCRVLAISRRVLPELDDELAKDAGDFDSLEALRAKIAEDHRSQQEKASERSLHESLVESLIGLTEFEVPPGVVERQLQGQMRQLHQQFQGRVPDEVIHQQMQRMREDGRPVAERRVREAFLIEKIVQDQGFSASEADVEGRLAEMAEAQGMEVNMLRSMAEQQGWLPAIEQELLEQSAYAWLADQATIEDVAAEPEEDSQAPA